MDSTEFLRRANQFLDQFNDAVHHQGNPPGLPDLTGFIPRTSEDYELLSQVLERCKILEQHAITVRDRAAAALKAPRLVRNEAILSGATLFSEV